jgi:hypothetical protein
VIRHTTLRYHNIIEALQLTTIELRIKQINYIIFADEADTDDAVFAIVGGARSWWFVFVLCPVTRNNRPSRKLEYEWYSISEPNFVGDH